MDGIRINTTAPEPDASATPAVVAPNADGSVSATAAPAAAATGTPAPAATTPPAVAPATTPPVIPKIAAPAESKKLDLSAAVKDFGKDGKVSDATYAAAEAQGVSRADVDTFIAGHKARVEGVATKLSEIAGSQDNLKAVLEWAGANTDQATRDAFNAAMDKADLPTASLMVRGLLSQYNDTVGVEGQRITGNAPGTGVQPFTSWEQVRTAMSDKRYARDSAYQAEVQKRMAASTFI